MATRMYEQAEVGAALDEQGLVEDRLDQQRVDDADRRGQHDQPDDGGHLGPVGAKQRHYPAGAVRLVSARAGVFVTMRRLLRGRYEGVSRNVPTWSHGRGGSPRRPNGAPRPPYARAMISSVAAASNPHPRPVVRVYVRLRQQHRTNTDTPRRRSAGLEAGAEEAELVAFRVGEDVPGLGAGLANAGGLGAEGEEAFELGFLVAVGGADVKVQAELAGRGSLVGLRIRVGCRPPKPMSGGPIAMLPSSSRPSST